jgi:hypothetical protein
MGCTQTNKPKLPSGWSDAEGHPHEAESFHVSEGYGGSGTDCGIHQGIEAYLGEVRRALRAIGRDRYIEDNGAGASRVHAEVPGHERELSGIRIRLPQAVPEVLRASAGVQVEMADNRTAKAGFVALSGGSREGADLQDEAYRGVPSGDGPLGRGEAGGDSQTHPKRLEGCTLDRASKTLGKEQAAVRLGASGLEARIRGHAPYDGQGGLRADLGSVGMLLWSHTPKVQCANRREGSEPQVPEDVRNLGSGCWDALGGCERVARAFLASRDLVVLGLEPGSDEGSDRASARTITVEASQDISIDNPCAPSEYWIRLPTYAKPLDRFRLKRFLSERSGGE